MLHEYTCVLHEYNMCARYGWVKVDLTGAAVEPTEVAEHRLRSAGRDAIARNQEVKLPRSEDRHWNGKEEGAHAEHAQETQADAKSKVCHQPIPSDEDKLNEQAQQILAKAKTRYHCGAEGAIKVCFAHKHTIPSKCGCKAEANEERPLVAR